MNFKHVASLTIVACVAIYASAVNAADKLKVGLLMPLTGVFAPIAEQEKWAFELAREEINNNGGILGRKIEFVYEDTEGNTKVATQKADKLYSVDKVEFVTGTVSSGVTLAVSSIAEKAKRPLIAAVSWSDAVTGVRCSPYVLRVNARAGQQAAALAEWVAKKYPKGKIMFVGPDYEMGRNVVSTFKKYALERGLKDVGQVFTTLDTQEFSPYFGKIRAAKPDVIFAPQAGNDAVRFFSQLHQFRVAKGIQLTGGAGTITPSNIGAIGEAAEGYVTGVGYVPTIQTANNKAFVAQIRKRHNKSPDLYGADAYGVLYLFKAAAEKAKSLETAKILAAMKGLTWDTPQGVKTIRAGDNQAIMDMFAVKISGGHFLVEDRIPGARAIGEDKCQRF